MTMKNTMLRTIGLVLVLCLLAPLALAEEPAAYKLDRVVILSRHNIRSPLSGGGSMLDEITPHEWFIWTSNPGELSLRGAMLETTMGQYFRLWLEKEGLFPENYRPEEGRVRFYANALQRTQATAHYFSTGLLPVAVVPVEMHAEYNTIDPVFVPRLTFMTDAYAEDIRGQIAELGGVAGMDGILAEFLPALELLMDVADVEQSEAYRSGKFGDFLTDPIAVKLENGKEASVTGAFKTAYSLADALTLQYYEEADTEKAAFGHKLTLQDWQLIHSIGDGYSRMVFEPPLVCVNAAHPLLQELRGEMSAEGREFAFLCGHDSSIASVLAALDVEEYLLPDAIEQRTPIGSKVVFERWLDGSGAPFYKVELVYQSVDQLRNISPLSLENPPMIYQLHFNGVEETPDGMIAEANLLERFDEKIAAYDALKAQYGEAEALAPAA